VQQVPILGDGAHALAGRSVVHINKCLLSVISHPQDALVQSHFAVTWLTNIPHDEMA
jgi:hypothetical protein